MGVYDCYDENPYWKAKETVKLPAVKCPLCHDRGYYMQRKYPKRNQLRWERKPCTRGCIPAMRADDV